MDPFPTTGLWGSSHDYSIFAFSLVQHQDADTFQVLDVWGGGGRNPGSLHLTQAQGCAS